MRKSFASRWRPVAAVVAAMALLAACANGRTVIQLPAPPAAGVAGAQAPAVRIGSVIDDRVFEDRPHQPSIPSLDGEGASRASPELRAHAVARKRNGYGMAQGDVVLSAREDMRDVVRANLALALAQAGYRVDDRDPAARRVDVHVRDFWLWLEPHTLVGVIRSRIVTDVAIDGAKPVTVAAETDQPGQIFSQEAWTNAVGVALTAWRTRAASDLRPQ
jgi:uncharacterized lipoprotein YajG